MLYQRVHSCLRPATAARLKTRTRGGVRRCVTHLRVLGRLRREAVEVLQQAGASRA